MSSIGFFDYLKQAGSVHLHEQNTLSDGLYSQLEGAKSTIKNAIKDTNLRVDIWDGSAAPEDKFVYWREPHSDCVYVEVKDLLNDTVESNEFWKKDRKGDFSVRRLYEFIDKSLGIERSPIEEMQHTTRRKYFNYLNNCKNKIVDNNIYELMRKNVTKLNITI